MPRSVKSVHFLFHPPASTVQAVHHVSETAHPPFLSRASSGPHRWFWVEEVVVSSKKLRGVPCCPSPVPPRNRNHLCHQMQDIAYDMAWFVPAEHGFGNLAGKFRRCPH